MTHSRDIKPVFVGIFIVTIIGTGLITTAAVGASIDTADRTVEDAELLPGETTEVTVEIELSDEAGPFLVEAFDPAFADVSIVSDDPRSQIGGPSDANDELAVGWGNDGTEYTITYEVTVPEDADPGDEFAINGTVTTSDADGDTVDEVAITGDTAITVVEQDLEFGERTIATDEVTPGGDVEVRTEIIPPAGSTPFLTETFDPAFETVTIETGDPAPTIRGVNDANSELTAGWDNPTENYTVEYVATVPEDAEPGDSYNFNGSVTVTEEDGDERIGEIVGDTNITVVSPPEGPKDYANEETGQVDGNGVANAFGDWQRGTADSKTLQEVFAAWQRGDIVL